LQRLVQSDAIRRLRDNCWTVAAAAIVFAGLALSGRVSPSLAIACFVAIIAAMLLHKPRTVKSNNFAAAALAPTRYAELQSIIESLPDAAAAVDRQEIVVACNEAARAIAPALRLGEPFSLAWRTPSLLAAMRSVAANGTPQRAEFSDRVPAERWYDVSIARMHAAAASPDGAILLMVFHDLTPLRRSEEMRADFVANASHELRTPLASLLGFIETLQGKARDDATARERFLDMMHAQARRMTRLIDDLLSLSRIELKEHVRPDGQVELLAVVRQVADVMQTLARDRGVEIRMDLTGGPIYVRGDRDELIRVFENLVENALKYAASGKRIDLAAAANNGEVNVLVRDYGPGIAPEHLPRLTERFYRVDAVHSRSEGGTGLGLALVKHILNHHGGRLSIASAPGEGATFKVQLPLAREDSTNC
jgi:two-component system, OmpR family, phosphate regulon sensor histidine kinase PhoR